MTIPPSRPLPPLALTLVLALTVALALLPPFAAPATAAPQITNTAVTQDGNLLRTEYLVQATPHPLDRFRLVRLVQEGPVSSLRGSILLLPPLGTNVAFYEQRDPNGGRGTSITEYFALRGFDVYAYSPRFEAIPTPLCETGLADCSVMAGWNIQSMVDDIAFIRGQIELLHPGTQIVTGGASLGGILAVAVANAAPGDYDGVIVWEGILASDDPTVLALNQGYCAALEAQIAAGAVFDGVGPSVFRQIAKQAEISPDSFNLIPLFPQTLTQHQVMVLLLSVPSPGPITMPVPNYIQMNGSLAEDRLFHASEARVFENVSTFNGYAPVVLVRDVSCSLAGVETDYTANLANYQGAVLAIGGGRGFGAYMQDQLARFTQADVTFLLEPDFGHIDHYMTADHRRYVEKPIYDWASRLFSQP